MLTYPWKCTVLHCNHLGNTWKPLVLMTRQFDYCPSASEGDNQSVRSSAPVVSRCFPGGYNVKLYISRGRLAWWLLAFLHSGSSWISSKVVLPSFPAFVVVRIYLSILAGGSIDGAMWPLMALCLVQLRSAMHLGALLSNISLACSSSTYPGYSCWNQVDKG